MSQHYRHQSHLPEQGHRLFLDLTGYQDLAARPGDFFQQSRSAAAAGDHRHSLHRAPGRKAQHPGRGFDLIAQPLYEILQRQRFLQYSPAADGVSVQVADVEMAVYQAGQSGQAGVVAELGMSIQRQMVGYQVQLVLQQDLQASSQPAVDYPAVTMPEQAVVYQQHLGTLFHRLFEEIQRHRGTGGNDFHLGLSLHLQAVGTSITKSFAAQQLIEIVEQHGPFGHVVIPPSWWSRCRPGHLRLSRFPRPPCLPSW